MVSQSGVWWPELGASFEDVIPQDVKKKQNRPRDLVCRFGNETMNLGDRFASEDPTLDHPYF